MGAKNARMVVKNQWRTNTTSRFFLVKVQIDRKSAIAPSNTRKARSLDRRTLNPTEAVGYGSLRSSRKEFRFEVGYQL